MYIMIPGFSTRLSFITCVMELEPLLTLWEGRSPGPVFPFSVLTLPMVPPIHSVLAMKPCFLWRLGWKSVLVSGLFFPIPSSMATLSLPVIKFSTQKHLTTDLGKRGSPESLVIRPFPSTLLRVPLGTAPHSARATGWQTFSWWTMVFCRFQVLHWMAGFLLPLLHSISITLESTRPWDSRTQFPCPPWLWLVWVEVEGCEK